MKQGTVLDYLQSGINSRNEWAAVMMKVENYLIELTGDYLQLASEKGKRTGESVYSCADVDKYPELLAEFHNARIAILLDAEDLKERLKDEGSMFE